MCRCGFGAYCGPHCPEEAIDLIAIFKEYAAQEEGLREQLGDNFARGHAQVQSTA